MLTFKEHYNPRIQIITVVTDLSEPDESHEIEGILCDTVTEASGHWHRTQNLDAKELERWLKIADAFDKVGYFHEARIIVNADNSSTEYFETTFPLTDNAR